MLSVTRTVGYTPVVMCTARAQVTCDDVILYVIRPGQFLDSSQYESAPQLNSTFKVHVRYDEYS